MPASNQFPKKPTMKHRPTTRSIIARSALALAILALVPFTTVTAAEQPIKGETKASTTTATRKPIWKSASCSAMPWKI